MRKEDSIIDFHRHHPVVQLSVTVRIIRITKGDLYPALFSSLVKCYQDIFSGEPWNEWRVCSVCGKKFNRNWELVDGWDSICCGEKLSEYWPESVVKNDILSEITKEGSSFWIAVIEPSKQVVGFCWGYSIHIDDLALKLGRKDFARKFSNIFPDVKVIAYQDDMGVLPQYRGKNIATLMFHERLQDFLTIGLTVGVVRTKRNPPSVTYSWFAKLDYKIVDEYEDEDDRVVLVKDLSKLYV